MICALCNYEKAERVFVEESIDYEMAWTKLGNAGTRNLEYQEVRKVSRTI